MAGDVLQWFPACAARDEGCEGLRLLRHKRQIVVRDQKRAIASEGVTEQERSVEPGFIYPVRAQFLRRCFDRGRD
jgi:hypothetical protein